MYVLLIFILMINFSTYHGESSKTKNFLANQNLQGYDERLLVKTLAKHYPDLNVNDKGALIEILSTEKGQLVLRDAAVKEMRKNIESKKQRNDVNESLDDESYCNYVWLSWLPWLSCPETKKAKTQLRYYQKVCS